MADTLSAAPFRALGLCDSRGGGPEEDFYLATDQYVLIDLQRESIEPLTGAPTSDSAHWWALGPPDWSSDGHAVVLRSFLQVRQ